MPSPSLGGRNDVRLRNEVPALRWNSTKAKAAGPVQVRLRLEIVNKVLSSELTS
jgi:hypothetical protein